STLNLNSPPFVPIAYQAVEDFSDQWGPSSNPPLGSAATSSRSSTKIPNLIFPSLRILTSSTTVPISCSYPAKGNALSLQKEGYGYGCCECI
ncbi:hypothetical protein LINGRAHAP2_LOCUS34705, partial [Linum grandiflorum]